VPLKRKYGDKISALARSRIHYIIKETFLSAFKATFERRCLHQRTFAQALRVLD
jgi:hypothetical protein